MEGDLESALWHHVVADLEVCHEQCTGIDTWRAMVSATSCC
jgi:hypothetical protein